MALPAPEEGKLLSEALSTVKIQVQQMKRHLVSISLNRTFQF
jgi:vacuolar protein sorting-associated protein 35